MPFKAKESPPATSSSMDHRFDVLYHSGSVTIDYHFCRSWDGDNGCYGTNPNHGRSWEEAKKEVADWHREQAKRWDAMSFEDWRGPTPPDDFDID